ncbi:uncharacterized protein PgNI_04760 [Pyricularia grisea]|uniref:Uncharacterized protein n=1 Tax=Pyricularia grisea TaxID=148305 RepID=A0A6P8BF10_PYRGI|nr:uncharacterized protein PgNI_04760 [Pyricularia grisea]TLD14319.1 hypothetical protein PgNI_04760 [Pyricularia grisea]
MNSFLVSFHVNGPAPSLLHVSPGSVRPSIHIYTLYPLLVGSDVIPS